MCDRDLCKRPTMYRVEEDNPFAHRVFHLCKEHYELRKDDIWKGWKVSLIPEECRDCSWLVNGVCTDQFLDKLCEPHFHDKEPKTVVT